MVKIQLDQGLEQVSADHVQPLESINYKFEPSKNNVLSSLHPMDENPRRHEKVYDCNKNTVSCLDFSIKIYDIHLKTA